MWVNKCPFSNSFSVSACLQGLSAQRNLTSRGCRGTFNKRELGGGNEWWDTCCQKLVLDWAEQCSSLALLPWGERQPQTSACWWRENAPWQPPRERRRRWGPVAWGSQPPSLSCSREGHKALCQVWDELPFSLDFEACEPPRCIMSSSPAAVTEGNVCWVIKDCFATIITSPKHVQTLQLSVEINGESHWCK